MKMNDDFTALAARNGGYIARHELLDFGLTDDHIRQALRDQALERIRHGTYAPSMSWAALTPMEKHRVLTHSVVDRLGHAVATSHVSAAAEHELESYDIDLSHIHLTRLDSSSGRREAGVVYHEGRVIAERDLLEIDGRLCVEPARAVAETCTTSSIESGMVTASSALRLGLADKEQLCELMSSLEHWRGSRHARIACQLSDKRFESVGEVRSFHMFWRWRVPMPELQYEVFTSHGRLIGRTDFAWLAFRHVGEFDGLMKYGRVNPFGRDPGRAITVEKVREDNVRAESFGMSRWIWSGLAPSQQGETVRMITRGMEQSRRLYLRNAVTIPLG